MSLEKAIKTHDIIIIIYTHIDFNPLSKIPVCHMHFFKAIEHIPTNVLLLHNKCMYSN